MLTLHLIYQLTNEKYCFLPLHRIIITNNVNPLCLHIPSTNDNNNKMILNLLSIRTNIHSNSRTLLFQQLEAEGAWRECVEHSGSTRILCHGKWDDSSCFLLFQVWDEIAERSGLKVVGRILRVFVWVWLVWCCCCGARESEEYSVVSWGRDALYYVI